MVSILIIFLCISIQIIFGFTYFITDEDIIKHNGKPSYNLALSGKRDDFTLRDFNLSAILHYFEVSIISSIPPEITPKPTHYFEILKRPDHDYEDDTNRLTFGFSQYDGAPRQEIPVRDLLGGSDNFFATEFEDGDHLGSSGKFQGTTILITV